MLVSCMVVKFAKQHFTWIIWDQAETFWN